MRPSRHLKTRVEIKPQKKKAPPTSPSWKPLSDLNNQRIAFPRITVKSLGTVLVS